MENANRQTNQEKIDYAAKELAYLLIQTVEYNRKLKKEVNKTKAKNEKSN